MTVPYNTKSLDLSAVTGLAELIGRGNVPTRLTILNALPSATAFSFVVRLGANSDDITITDYGVLEFEDGAPDGIWWRNDTAQAGVSVQVLVGYGASQSFNR